MTSCSTLTKCSSAKQSSFYLSQKTEQCGAGCYSFLAPLMVECHTIQVYQWHSWTSPNRADQKLSEGVGDPTYWVHVGPTVVSLKHA